jgi:hypothetical protein
MTTEREQILQMVAAGRLSVEQADQLLEVLGEPATTAQAEGGERSEIGRQPRGRPRVALRAGRGHARHNALVGELVALGASVAYMKELNDAGLMDDLPAELLVSLTAVKADAGYIRALRDAGVTDALPADLLTSLTALRGDVTILREVHELGLADLPEGLLTSLIAVGTSPADIREMRDMGLTNLPEDLLTSLVVGGARGAAIKEMCDAGLLDLLQDAEEGEEVLEEEVLEEVHEPVGPSQL